MTKYILPFCLFALCSYTYAQDSHLIDLKNGKINDFEQRSFYFNEVIDDTGKKDIGHTVKQGISATLTQLYLQGGTKYALKNLLDRSFEPNEELLALQLVVKDLEIRRTNDRVTVSFYGVIVLNDTALFTHEQVDTFNSHLKRPEYDEFIVKTIQNYIYNFANVPKPEQNKKEIISELPKNEENYEDFAYRNVTAVGYQIGGYSLVGIDYEHRVSNVLGVHGGAGYLGFTLGLKFHFKSGKDGTFINMSFKDGGFGRINGYALELGGRRAFKGIKGDLGIHSQIGVAMITQIDNTLAKQLGISKSIPFASLSLGIGLSW